MADDLVQNPEKNYGGLVEVLVDLQQLLAGRPSFKDKYQSRIEMVQQKISAIEKRSRVSLESDRPEDDNPKKVKRSEPSHETWVDDPEDTDKFTVLMRNDPKFVRSPSLEEMKPLFDSSSPIELRLSAREKLDKAYKRSQSRSDTNSPQADTAASTTDTSSAKQHADKQEPSRAGNEKEVEERLIRENEIRNFRPSNNYYILLGVPMNASMEQIKTAYKGLAKKFHSDVVLDLSPELQLKSQRIIQAINEAKSVLSNDAKRAQYDLTQPIVRTNEARPGVRQEARRAHPLDDFFRDLFNGGFSMGNFDMSGFGSPPFAQKPRTPETPVQKAEAQSRAKEQQMRTLENNVRRARNIGEIVTALEELQKLGYSLEYTNYQDYHPARGFGKNHFSAEQLIALINTAVKNMRAEPRVFDASIDALPGEMNIKYRVKSELENRRDAFDTLRKVDPNLGEIRTALEQLSRMTDQVTTKVNGLSEKVNLEQQIDFIRKISVFRSQPESANTLITQVTHWNDIDLKIYYELREKSYSRRWENSIIPPSIAQRYKEYIMKRASG